MHDPTKPSNVNMHAAERYASVLGGAWILARSLRPGNHKALAVLGGELIRRGITGHSYFYSALDVQTNPDSSGHYVSVRKGIRGRAAITIARPRSDVYRFWHRLENLPRIMEHVRSVDASAYPKVRWKVEGPGSVEISWDAEVHNEIENELIAWRSLPGAELNSAGSVHFKDAPGGRGTEVIVNLQYWMPSGWIGEAFAKLFGRDPETEIESGLIRLKQLLEAGELAGTEGQPKGQTDRERRRTKRKAHARARSPRPQSTPAPAPVTI